MTDEAPTPAEPAAQAPPATTVAVGYEDASRLVTAGGTAQLALFANVHRDPVRLDGVIKDPLRFREALAVLYAVVGSDYRYVPKDRTAYLAYRRMRAESAHMGLWQAQQAYFQAYHLEPANPDYAYNVAVGLDHLGQRKLALEFYRRAEQLALQRGRSNFEPAHARERINKLGAEPE